MIGIDIVDLKDPLFHYRDERAFRLIKHPEESICDHHNAFWLYWTAKEAVFKQYRKRIHFKPKHYKISISSNHNKIMFRSEIGLGEYVISDEYILAIAYPLNSNYTFKVCNVSDQNILDLIQLELNFEESVGQDSLGLPIILPTGKTVSITDHGRFGAYVIADKVPKV